MDPRLSAEPIPEKETPEAIESIMLDQYRVRKASMQAEPAPLAPEKAAAAKQRLYALLHSPDTDSMEEVSKPKELLAVLEDALKQAHLTVTIECDISELVCQRQRAQQPIGLAHAEALDLVATLEQDNEAQLGKARKMVADLASKVTTLKATLKALQPAVLVFSVPFDPTLPYHASLKMLFKYDHIPTDPKAGKID
ncbi:hypothetical protein BGX33_001251 [Mortierella sp. NVP41]|nr:hypothetical protein BGX33_001251 [Mortierella sp. NVP41]